jgi:hypothetical protein
MAATITIGDKEYDVETELTGQQQYMVSQIEAANRTEAKARFELDQAMMLKMGFSEALTASIASQEEQDGENGDRSTQAD